MPAVADFIAHEFYQDFTYIPRYRGIEFMKFDQNDFTNVGPGASIGIRLIYPSLKTVREQKQAIYWLRDLAEEWLTKIGDEKSEKMVYLNWDMKKGGEGTLGHVCSEESKRKMSQQKLGKNKGCDNYKSKPVSCDGGYWETISDFCKEYGYTRRTVEKWLYGESAMPCEWYDKNLRLANEIHDIKRQDKRWQNTIYYDGMVFKSQAAFAKYVGKYPADVCRWIKNDKVPQEYIEKGFSINKPVND